MIIWFTYCWYLSLHCQGSCQRVPSPCWQDLKSLVLQLFVEHLGSELVLSILRHFHHCFLLQSLTFRNDAGSCDVVNTYCGCFYGCVYGQQGTWGRKSVLCFLFDIDRLMCAWLMIPLDDTYDGRRKKQKEGRKYRKKYPDIQITSWSRTDSLYLGYFRQNFNFGIISRQEIDGCPHCNCNGNLNFHEKK